MSPVLQQQQIQIILEMIKTIQIAIIGDFCLDIYWTVEPEKSEISLETGLATEPVSQQRYSLGGAGNIAANLASLQPKNIRAVGVTGDDLFGFQLRNLLRQLRIDTRFLIKQKHDFQTYAYCKRYIKNREQPRIDFGRFNRRSLQTDQKLLEGLEDALSTSDVVIFNQQVSKSIPNRTFFEKAEQLLTKNPEKIVIFDSRDYGDKLTSIYRKINEREALQLFSGAQMISPLNAKQELTRIGTQLFGRSQRPVFITRAEKGVLVFDNYGCTEIPGLQIPAPVDIVGAGDTFVSALACALAVAVKPANAAEFANFAAGVTVRKLQTTGVAEPREILQISREPDFLFNPDLAGNYHSAQFYKDTRIEIVDRLFELKPGKIKHVFFDHDGTISTLRLGWQEVMREVMIEAISGGRGETIDRQLLKQIKNRVEKYIDDSTGIQTILQMEALTDMIREFGLIEKEHIQDELVYKNIFNKELMKTVQRRIDGLKSGRLQQDKFIINGALAFLEKLKRQGLTLYLASGTDQEDVIEEARILGYGDLFNGGIFGSVGDVQKYSKKLLLEKVMAEKKLCGRELIFFGDGPVEMRECRRRGGMAVGVASEEKKRCGLNHHKRERLIKAGAHIVIPDFNEADGLIELLFTD